jgi:hypothetical protein
LCFGSSHNLFNYTALSALMFNYFVHL